MNQTVSIPGGIVWRYLTWHVRPLLQKQLEFQEAIAILLRVGCVWEKRKDSSSLLRFLPNSVSAWDWMALIAPEVVSWPLTACEKFILKLWKTKFGNTKIIIEVGKLCKVEFEKKIEIDIKIKKEFEIQFQLNPNGVYKLTVLQYLYSIQSYSKLNQTNTILYSIYSITLFYTINFTSLEWERKKTLLRAGKIMGDWSGDGWEWIYYDTME